MKRDIRMIGLDLDGTVLNSKKEMTPAVVAAIQRALDAGVVVLPATGRAVAGVPAAFTDIPGVRYVLAANGAMVYDLKEQKALRRDCFDKATALALLDVMEAWDASVSVLVEGEAYAELLQRERVAALVDPGILDYMQASRRVVPNLRAFVQQCEKPIDKYALLFYQPAQRDEAMQVLGQRTDCVLTSSLPHNLELNTPTATKGRALLWLAQRLGISQSQVMAVGDGLNDVDMLERVGYPVAMGNSAPEVLALAAMVTKSCDEDGVAYAINSVIGNQ